MELSIVAARFIGLLYISVGLALFTRQIDGKELITSFKNSPGLSLIAGIIGLGIGVFLIYFHNIWVANWPVLITILGWIALIEGFVYIAFPKALFAMAKNIFVNEKIWGTICFALGLLFGYFGFLR